MKPILIILFTLILSFNAFCQPRSLSSQVKAALPLGNKKLTEKERNALVNYRFANEWKSLHSYTGHTYTKNNLILEYIIRKNLNLPNQTLEYNLQFHLDVLSQLNAIIRDHEIIMVNSIRYGVYNYELGGDGYWGFTSEPNKEDEHFKGTITYTLGDEANAYAYLQEFLKGFTK